MQAVSLIVFLLNILEFLTASLCLMSPNIRMIHLLFTCGSSASLFCLSYPFSIKEIAIKNSLNCDIALKSRKALTTKHAVAMVVTVDYSDPRMEPDVKRGNQQGN